MAKILIIDDDQNLNGTLCGVVSGMGHQVTPVYTLSQGLQQVEKEDYDLILLDVQMPDGNGLDHVGKFQGVSTEPEVIIMTGAGDPDGAEEAIRSGAWDYIEKPSTLKGITLPVLRALEYRQEKKNRRSPVALKREGIFGQSAPMEECLDLVAQAASNDSNVLITGQTGTGKELLARAIHHNSDRAGKNFVVVDCAVLPETLVESVLFGHEKGAFTGAEQNRQGLIKQADGGTLFLDEVGEMPLSIQKAFLRVLQERRFRPVGSPKEEQSHFRLIAATNRDLDDMVKSGGFRDDLLFRLKSLLIPLPPLRDRKEDIKEIALHYISKICERQGLEMKGVCPEFFDALSKYNWPGNVRELVHTLEGVLSEARYESTLYPKHLPTAIRVSVARASVTGGSDRVFNESEQVVRNKPLPKLQDLRGDSLARAESRYLKDLVVQTKGNIKQACEISGVSRSRLYDLLRKYNIAFPR